MSNGVNRITFTLIGGGGGGGGAILNNAVLGLGGNGADGFIRIDYGYK